MIINFKKKMLIQNNLLIFQVQDQDQDQVQDQDQDQDQVLSSLMLKV